MKHYTKDDGRVALQNGDVICFGFNIGSVYDINDPNVFTYLLKKEAIVTIELDSDDECTEQTARQVDTTAHNDDVYEIDSDSEHSGDECFEDIDDMNDEHMYSGQSNEPYSTDEDEIDESSNDASSVASFVVTKTILNPLTPSDGEIVELSDDESPEITSSEQVNDKTSQDVNTEDEQQKPDSTSDESEKAHTAEACDEPSSSAAISVSGASTSAAVIIEGSSSSPVASNSNIENIPNDEQNRLAKVRKRIAEKAQKKTSVTNAKPIKKRRRTFTENEYKQRVDKRKIDPQEVKRLRLERLAKIAADKKAEKEAHGEGSGEQHRTQFVPRVKNTSVSRSAMLSEDMLQKEPFTNPTDP